jgi:uncharacterized membrane protein YkvI
MDVKRIHIAVICIIAYLGVYSLLLWNAYTAFIPDEAEMRHFIRKVDAFKWLAFGLYFVSNSLMALTYRSQIEKEILLTGIFSIIFITVLNTLHKLSILVMSTQLTLILFNGITIALLVLVLREGNKHGLFKQK